MINIFTQLKEDNSCTETKDMTCKKHKIARNIKLQET